MAKKSRKKPTEIRFHYLKAPTFRTVPADGAIGGMTPQGQFHIGFYSERVPIPKETVHEVSAEGALGPEIRSKRQALVGIVRELQVDIVLSVPEARVLRDWLDAQVGHAEKLMLAAGRATKSKP